MVLGTVMRCQVSRNWFCIEAELKYHLKLMRSHGGGIGDQLGTVDEKEEKSMTALSISR